MSKVHFGGSRVLGNFYTPIVKKCVNVALEAGCFVHVGCAVGADAEVINSVVRVSPSRLHVFAQFSPTGTGSFSGSDVAAVQHAEREGARVSYLAGGPVSLYLKARLIRRSVAALTGCVASVFFLGSPSSRGSLNVAKIAAKRRQLVYAIPCGFDYAPNALAGLDGFWEVAQFAGFPAFQWLPAAGYLF